MKTVLQCSTKHNNLLRSPFDLVLKKAAVELEDAISAYPDRVEGAVLTFMEKFTVPNLSATRKLTVLIRRGARPFNPVHNMPRHPVYTGRDFEAPLMAPRAAPRFFPDIMPSRQLGLFLAHREIFNTRLGIMSGFVVTPTEAWKNSKPNLIWVV